MAVTVLNTDAGLSGKTLAILESAQTVSGAKTFTAVATMNAGVAFPASQAASTDVNVLDDYEEGTFTPGLQFGGGTTGLTYGARSGQYVKIGKNVWFKFNLTLTAKGSSSGAAKVAGLPFTEADAVNAGASIGVASNFTGLTGALGVYVEASSAAVAFTQSAATGNEAIGDGSFTNTTVVEASGWYRASA